MWINEYMNRKVDKCGYMNRKAYREVFLKNS